MSINFEEVYRMALKLPPDEQRQLVDYLIHPPPPLSAAEILRRLESHAGELREMGVEKIGLFGSYARGEADPASDIDVLVIMAGDGYSLFGLVGIKLHLEECLGHPVDVVPEDSLRPEIRPHVMREVIYAEGV
jgi:hypothetical protein